MSLEGTTSPSLAIGIDLGATKIAAALVTKQGQVIANEQMPTEPNLGVTQVLDKLSDIILSLTQHASAPIQGIGIGTPGRVDPKTGIIHNAVNLGWREVALAAEIKNRLSLNIPIYIHKDANAEVLGEAYFGAGQGCKNLVYIGLGSGLGGGAIADGRLIIGDDLTASEIGHLSLDPTGRVCSCGQYGCAETVVSGRGALALAREYLAQQNETTILRDTAELTPQMIVNAAYENDKLARKVLGRVADWLGQIVAIYAIILNPGRVVIGGGFGRAAFELLLPDVQTTLQRRALAMTHQHLQIVPSQLESSAVGASCLVWHHQQ